MGYIHRKGFSSTSSGYAIGAAGSEVTVIDGSGAITVPSGQVLTIPGVILSLPGRISTSTAAGASLALDASTHTYAEGLELRYHIADWADVATWTEATGAYIRMENREANASGSIYGAQIWGVQNNVANTQYIWGSLVYAYAKGTTASTITGMYAIQPELSFDAGASAHTISEAACVRAKVTGGAMVAYTNLHGYILVAGDMDGGSRTYGNALWVLDDAAMSGTSSWTKGIYLQAGCTTAIDIDSATTGIDLSTASAMTQNIILGGNGRVSTGSAAGSSLAIDATTSSYGEGFELRYHMADWADGATTLTDAKGMYLRMENREANSNGSVYGLECYGVSNNVANTKYIWGGLFYAYVKDATACTITGMYAIQPELSFDAGASQHTVTEAACVRAKITSGNVAAYTNIHGYKLIAGDMDGGSRTYGNAFWVVDDGDMSGTSTWTRGLYINCACTSDIVLQSGSSIVDSNHLDIETLSDTKRVRLNDRNYAATSGDIIGFSAKPAANASGTQTVYGGQISPRANDNVDVAALIGLQVEPIMKGASVLAISGDLRGLDVRLTSEGANTVGGIAGNIFCYNLLKSATFTGGVYPIVVKPSGDTQAWTGLMEIPAELVNAANGSGADTYIEITIGGTAARITAKYVS